MNFTREPIIETVITPKEGHKLALRNSKGGGQEEFFIDSLEVISFGKSAFYRSLEKPKCFVVPVGDYEILEVREARMVLKSAKVEPVKIERATKKKEESAVEEVDAAALEKKKEKRRPRKRRTKAEEMPPEEEAQKVVERRSLIPPPSTLISETIGRYKEVEVHETAEEQEPAAKKKEESSEEPSEDSSDNSQAAPVENSDVPL